MIYLHISGVQGVVLYRQLRASIFSSRFIPGKLQVFLTCAIGYGVPVCFVTSLLIKSQLDEVSHYIRISDNPDTDSKPTLCWIDLESMLWAFIGPLIAILAMNFVIIIMVLKTALESTLRSR